jgi:hypothetical protein
MICQELGNGRTIHGAQPRWRSTTGTGQRTACEKRAQNVGTRTKNRGKERGPGRCPTIMLDDTWTAFCDRFPTTVGRSGTPPTRPRAPTASATSGAPPAPTAAAAAAARPPPHPSRRPSRALSRGARCLMPACHTDAQDVWSCMCGWA